MTAPSDSTDRARITATGPDADDFAYNPVPPERSVAITVCFHLGGPGQPLGYLLDEDPDEHPGNRLKS